MATKKPDDKDAKNDKAKESKEDKEAFEELSRVRHTVVKET